jgi:hypothetical protein
MRDRDARDSNELSPLLRDAVRQLRDDAAEPTDIWRQRLLRDVAAAPVPAAKEPVRWSMRPIVAAAAAVVFMAIGAGAVLLTADSRSADSRTADNHGARIRFTFDAPAATTVSLVGDFNGWAAGSLPLRRSSDGRTWEVEVPLAPGRYAYSFMVDGRLASDPSAPKARDDEFGTTNSVVMVKGS